jgi:hypothetical protein
VAVRIAAGSCDGLSTPRPLGPIIEIAAQLEVDSALPRDELFAAILDALEQQSTVVLVEDLHWADDATPTSCSTPAADSIASRRW